ncbi:MAG: hypothetical protein Fur0043_11280 [Anaerolineales bacterium]
MLHKRIQAGLIYVAITMTLSLISSVFHGMVSKKYSKPVAGSSILKKAAMVTEG